MKTFFPFIYKNSASDQIHPLKGLCQEMTNFFEGFKNQISTFCICADGYQIFLLSSYEETRR
jgi:hypothetical protein